MSRAEPIEPDPFADIDAMSAEAERFLADNATLYVDERGDAFYDVTNLDVGIGDSRLMSRESDEQVGPAFSVSQHHGEGAT